MCKPKNSFEVTYVESIKVNRYSFLLAKDQVPFAK